MIPPRPDPQIGKDVTRLKYLAPYETQRSLIHYMQNCRNMGLLLTRYLPWEAVEKVNYLSERGNHRPEGKWSNQWLLTIANYFPIQGGQNVDNQWRSLVSSTYNRWKLTTQDAHCFTAVAQARIVVGLGSKGALETGLTLHPITGLPTIPGSALKGLCRSYALWSIAVKLGRKTEQEELLDLDKQLATKGRTSETNVDEAEYYRQAFGSMEDSGGCIFFEAVVSRLPQQGTLFEADVMTPHYAGYYKYKGDASVPASDKPFPSDDQNLVPITFMTIAADTQFAFAVKGVRGTQTETIKQVAQWLQSGLHEFGVGAKTAAGYGVFEQFQEC